MTTTRMSVSESEHRRRIPDGADDSGKHDALHAAHQRIEQLEKQCAVLAAEVDRLRREYNEEVAEFSAGFQAAAQGLPATSEPLNTKHDVWKCGYAWGRYPVLVAQVDRMRPVVDAARVLVSSLRRRESESWSGSEDALERAVAEYKSAIAAQLAGEG